MKCPKCSYTSFDYLQKCKKCGELLEDSRKSLNLQIGEPTLFAGLDDEPLEVEKHETEKIEDKVDNTEEVEDSSFDKTDFSLPVSDQLPEPPMPQKMSVENPSENISSGPGLGIGALGGMDAMPSQPEGKKSVENTPKFELDSSPNVDDGFELAPSFNADNDNDDTEEPAAEEENQKSEFVLSMNEEKLETDEPLNNAAPFELSGNDPEDDIDLKVLSDNSDKDFIDLELDMNDEESLDQILADLEKKE